jgi:hypothetical protein
MAAAVTTPRAPVHAWRHQALCVNRAISPDLLSPLDPLEGLVRAVGRPHMFPATGEAVLVARARIGQDSK